MRFLLVLLAALTMQAKEPWQWTAEERIAARTDPAQIRRRVEEARGRGAVRAEAVSAQRTADVLSGAAHPELYLPTEIVTTFAASAYAADDEVAKGFRQDAAIHAAEAGLPADFLRVFETEGASFIDAVTRERALREKVMAGTAESIAAHAELRVLEETELCPRRFALIERMRELYGVRFDRFLYGGIVRGMSRTYVGEPPSAETLSREMRGCR